MSNPIEELGKTLSAQMQHAAHANTGITIELGTIGNNMSLKVASLGNAIPKGDYMISLHLQQSEETGKLRGLKAKDRVLVAWVGTEPVVVDIVVSS